MFYPFHKVRFKLSAARAILMIRQIRTFLEWQQVRQSPHGGISSEPTSSSGEIMAEILFLPAAIYYPGLFSTFHERKCASGI